MLDGFGVGLIVFDNHDLVAVLANFVGGLLGCIHKGAGHVELRARIGQSQRAALSIHSLTAGDDGYFAFQGE